MSSTPRSNNNHTVCWSKTEKECSDARQSKGLIGKCFRIHTYPNVQKGFLPNNSTVKCWHGNKQTCLEKRGKHGQGPCYRKHNN
jgi:hypothetical protein